MSNSLFCFFNDTATTEIYTYLHTLSLHDALPICPSDTAIPIDDPTRTCSPSMEKGLARLRMIALAIPASFSGWLICGTTIWNSSPPRRPTCPLRSEEHTSELQSLVRISYSVFCLKKKHSKANHDIDTHLQS